jgi:tRNA (pseudouridine54-N1)-methyltransferase
MQEFLLYSRTGRTAGDFTSLLSAGRLDVVYQCILMAIFKAGAHRDDVIFHAILGGAPKPPVHLEVSGNELRDARIDERSWEGILKEALNGVEHPGIKKDTTPLQKLVADKHEAGYKIFVLSNEGAPFNGKDLAENNLFVLGDQIGLPKADESFVLRYGTKLSLGKEKYLAASCIDIINYLIDAY